MVKDDGNRPGLSPLAQQAVKAYLMIHSMSLADYRKLYAQTGQKLAQDSEHGTDETEYAEIIPFEISLQALSVEDDKLLLFCSFMGSSNIALDILSHFLKSPQESKSLPHLISIPRGSLVSLSASDDTIY
jgi:hypothetical protein